MLVMADQGCGAHWPHSDTCELGVVKSSGSELDGRTPYSWKYEGGDGDGALIDWNGKGPVVVARQDHTELKPIFSGFKEMRP